MGYCNRVIICNNTLYTLIYLIYRYTLFYGTLPIFLRYVEGLGTCDGIMFVRRSGLESWCGKKCPKMQSCCINQKTEYGIDLYKTMQKWCWYPEVYLKFDRGDPSCCCHYFFAHCMLSFSSLPTQSKDAESATSKHHSTSERSILVCCQCHGD